VLAYYYPWYGTPARSGHWVHWNANGLNPPDDIAAPFYPTLSPYDSQDPGVLWWHLAWAQLARLDALVVSWWGRDSFEDQRLPTLFAAAAQTPVKLALLLEPYAGQTSASFAADIEYLCQRWFSHPATLKVARPTAYGPNPAPRPLLFVYDPPITANDTAWLQTVDAIRGTACDAIVLLRGDDSLTLTDGGVRYMTSWLHADGVFNYGSYTYATPLPSSPDYLVVPAVAPGFDTTRVGGTASIGRQAGARYDQSWSSAIGAGAQWVAVASFNEWHEGTQIEPAAAASSASYRYEDYEGHYGATGLDAAVGYLNRTAYWVERFRAGPVP